MIHEKPQVEYVASLASLANSVVDLDSLQPLKYRLIDCIAFIQEQTLSIVASKEFPHVNYCAISYIWRGNPIDPNDAEIDIAGTFAVKGSQLDSDPISIEVLRHACIASVQHGADYLWLDRVCIIQTSREDKTWQIRRMYDIYRGCMLCLVLPGGIRRLVGLQEETAWIHRAWTLQETLAPRTALALFRWAHGSCKVLAARLEGQIYTVVPQLTALCHVEVLVAACAVGQLKVPRGSGSSSDGDFDTYDAAILGRQSPCLEALGIAMSGFIAVSDPDAKDHAMWQCALMRTSSRPVDMVLSIMGLFGVSLDPSAFRSDDRLAATMALAQEILRMGKRASWVGISFKAPPCRQLSTFPEFPQTSVSGSAYVQTDTGRCLVARLVDVGYPVQVQMNGESLPRGVMDDEGYMHFSCKAAPVRQVLPIDKTALVFPSAASHEHMLMTAADKTMWQVVDTDEDTSDPRVFAILLGWFQKYAPAEVLPAWHPSNIQNIRLLLVKEHAPGRFYVITGSSVDYTATSRVLAWAVRNFSVGGPEPPKVSPDILRVSIRALPGNGVVEKRIMERYGGWSAIIKTYRSLWHSPREGTDYMAEQYQEPAGQRHWFVVERVVEDPTVDSVHSAKAQQLLAGTLNDLWTWNPWLPMSRVARSGFLVSRKCFALVIELTAEEDFPPFHDGERPPIRRILPEAGVFLHGKRCRVWEATDPTLIFISPEDSQINVWAS